VTEPTIASAIDLLDERFALAPLPAANRPVFVLAAGWRSGSTLMQRLVASTGEIFMWGEPYDHAALVMRLAESLLPIGQRWPPKDAIVDGAAYLYLANVNNTWVHSDKLQGVFVSPQELLMRFHKVRWA